MARRTSFLVTVLALLLAQPVFPEGFTLYTNPFASGISIAVSLEGHVWFKSGGFLVGFDPDAEGMEVFRLPSSYPTNQVAVDTNGNPWVHCGDAICRVIGGQLQTFMFPGSSETVIAASPDGSVWASLCTHDESGMRFRIIRFNGTGWEDIQNPVSNTCPKAICFGPGGTGWFAWTKACSPSLARFRDGGWEGFTGLPYTSPTGMAAAGADEVWIADWVGVYHVSDGALVSQYSYQDGLAGHNADGLAIDALNRVWVTDSSAGVSMFDAGQWTVFNTLNSGLPSNNVNGVAAGPEGSLFFTTGAGLARYRQGLWSTYTGAETTVLNNDIYSVAVDDLGRTFYGTLWGQVGYFDGSRWKALYDPGVNYVDNVFDIAFGPDGTVWLACQSNLKAWRGTLISYPSAGPGAMGLERSTRLCVGANEALWVCANEGLAKYDGQTWSCFQAYTGSPPAPVTPDSIACDHEGRIWVGTSIGVATIKDDQLAAFLPGYQYVSAIACDQDGLLWFGFGASERGVLEFDGQNEIAWYTVDDGLPSNQINCLACDSADHIWVGTDDGLGYFDRATWTKYDVDSGFAVNEIRDIFAAPNGDVWFATPAGLICRESGVQPPKLSISIATDKPLYHAGDTMTVSLSYHNPGPAVFVDIHVACLLPDGSLYYYPGGDTPVPFSSGLLPSGTSIPMVLVLTYEFPPDFPVGGYTWMTAMFAQGTFNILTDIATAPFTFE